MQSTVTYDCHIGAPILFTAPHSAALMRGGQLYNQKQRKHSRQCFTSIICLRLSNRMRKYFKQNGSFCVWKTTHRLHHNDLDPNYLMQKNMRQSPFHWCLHTFAQKNIDFPLLHVDIHGKFDRNQNCQIDLGIQPMNQIWQQQQLKQGISILLKKQVDLIFKGHKFGLYQQRMNVQPYLSGMWGAGIMTISQQSIRMGIPAFQLQIPLKQLCDKLGDAIYQTYKQVVIPWFAVKNPKYKINKQISNYSVQIKQKIQQKLKQFTLWELNNIKIKKMGI